MSHNFNNYMSFSKKEGIGAIALLCIIIPMALLPFLHKDQEAAEPEKDNMAFISDALKKKGTGNNEYVSYESTGGGYPAKYKRNYKNYNSNMANARLFRFDPNTASPDQLTQLGLRDRTVQILTNYRNKGGKFRKADDLQKIYGLRPEEFERLKPFIVIESAQDQNSFQYTKHENAPYAETPRKEFRRKVVVIDINMADTTAFQSLYGIGSKLASRIVNFRNKLGGFYSIEQVGETYGMPDSTFQKIKSYLRLGDAGIRKMNINTASYEELNAHPYISSKLAYLIMKHRKENGNFNDLDPLKDLVSQTNDSFEKVVNYLTSK